MPRPAKTPAQRADDVRVAAKRLADAIETATLADRDPSCSAEVRRVCWADVEEYGATIHRQSRLLAGKSKGG